MPISFKLGQTKEDKEKQKAEELRQLEYEVAERNRSKQAKLEKLKRKSKTMKIIVISLFVLFSLALLVFGTYNTFFKHSLTEDDIIRIIGTETATYNTSGVTGFIVENAPLEITKYLTKTDNIEYYNVDPTSIRVNKIIVLDQISAAVYFTSNIEVKTKDVVTKNSKGETITTVGETFNTNYTFYTILNYLGGDGYSFGSALGFTENAKILSTKNEFKENHQIAFDNVPIDDETTTITKKTKVERILADIYDNKNVASDFESSGLTFNNPDEHSKFIRINEFISYKSENMLGFNAYCTYIVENTDGLQIIKVAYLKIEPNGQSYKITRFM